LLETGLTLVVSAGTDRESAIQTFLLYNAAMLARYKIPYMQSLPAGAPEAAKDAIRQDSRKHTKHCLRPAEEMVERFLEDPDAYPWAEFVDDYRNLLAERFGAERAAFDQLAELARTHLVFLGCSCPTKKNPDVNNCHTVLALYFMKQRYPDIDVVFP